MERAGGNLSQHLRQASCSPPILPLRGIDHMRAPLDTFGHDSRLRQLQRITNAMKRQKPAI